MSGIGLTPEDISYLVRDCTIWFSPDCEAEEMFIVFAQTEEALQAKTKALGLSARQRSESE